MWRSATLAHRRFRRYPWIKKIGVLGHAKAGWPAQSRPRLQQPANRCDESQLAERNAPVFRAQGRQAWPVDVDVPLGGPEHHPPKHGRRAADTAQRFFLLLERTLREKYEGSFFAIQAINARISSCWCKAFQVWKDLNNSCSVRVEWIFWWQIL